MIKHHRVFINGLPKYPQAGGQPTSQAQGYSQLLRILPWANLEMVGLPYEDAARANTGFYDFMAQLPTFAVDCVHTPTGEAFKVYFRLRDRKWNASRFSRGDSIAVLTRAIMEMIDTVYPVDTYDGVEVHLPDERMNTIWHKVMSRGRWADVATRMRDKVPHFMITMHMPAKTMFLAQPAHENWTIVPFEGIPREQYEKTYTGSFEAFGKEYEFLLHNTLLPLKDVLAPETVLKAISDMFDATLPYVPRLVKGIDTFVLDDVETTIQRIVAMKPKQ